MFSDRYQFQRSDTIKRVEKSLDVTIAQHTIKIANRKGWLKRVFGKKEKTDLLISQSNRIRPTRVENSYILEPRLVPNHDIEQQLDDIAIDGATNYALANGPQEKLEMLNRYSLLVDEAIDSFGEEVIRPNALKKAVKKAIILADPGYYANTQPEIVQRHKPTESVGVQTATESIAIDTTDLEESIAFTLTLQNGSEPFVQANLDKMTQKIKKAMQVTAARELTYYLKCKYAFSIRNTTLLTGMRTDARVWLLSKDYKLNTEVEYKMVTSSVIAAFMIDPSEFAIYQLLASKNFWNAATAYNTALQGEVQTKLPSIFSPGTSLRGHTRGVFPKNVSLILNKTNPTC